MDDLYGMLDVGLITLVLSGEYMYVVILHSGATETLELNLPVTGGELNPLCIRGDINSVCTSC